jgi:hypothetical protein
MESSNQIKSNCKNERNICEINTGSIDIDVDDDDDDIGYPSDEEVSSNITLNTRALRLESE